MNALSALDVLRMKTDKAPLENAVALFADYELEARQDGRNIIASLAAAELAALRQERDELRAVVEAARGLLRAVDGFGPVGSVYEKRNELAAALERVKGKSEK